MAKFESSDNGGIVASKPNAPQWRNISITTMYNNSRAMETNSTYGWGTSGSNLDTHMLKNTEWGAAAYLSQSIFGKNGEVWVNNNADFTLAATGCAGPSASADAYDGCQFAYNTANGQNASTSRNVTGIYDMSGGLNEYVMGNLDNREEGAGISPSSIPNKYIDRYSSTVNYGYNNTYYGDAFYETSFNAKAGSSGIYNGG